MATRPRSLQHRTRWSTTMVRLWFSPLRELRVHGAVVWSETFHFSSHQLTSAELIEALRRELGPRRVRRVLWRALRWLGPFVPMLRQLLEVKYLWDQPVLLDDRKLRQFLGELRRTPLDRALRATLQPTPAAYPRSADRR